MKDLKALEEIYNSLPDGKPRGEIKASPRNEFLGTIADGLKSVVGAKPLKGLIAGEIIDSALGGTASLIDDISYQGLGALRTGGNVATGGIGTIGIDPRAAELALNVVPVGSAVKEGGKVAAKQLGPKAAEMADNYMSERGLIMRAIPEEKLSLAKQMGLRDGFYRGGVTPKTGANGDTPRTGPWYTMDKEEAEGYAKRFGDGDVREYAVPDSSKILKADASYAPKLAGDVARLLKSDREYYGKQANILIDGLLDMEAKNERIGGPDLWQFLESRYGNDGAAEILMKATNGHFQGTNAATGNSAELYVFPNGVVRDAKKAKFDPLRRSDDDIYGKAEIPILPILGGASLGGAAVARSVSQSPQDQERER